MMCWMAVRGGDTLVGGAGNDVLRAGNGDNTEYISTPLGYVYQYISDVLSGEEGDDRLYSDGHDFLTGGAGNDRFYLGGTGLTVAYGDEGDDTFYVTSNNEVIIHGGDGFDRVVVYGNFNMGAVQADVERLVVRSTEGAYVTGNAYDNVIVGGSGADTLTAGIGGNDQLNGGAGDDVLMVGTDVFPYGHTGHVALTGGAGADTFYFGGAMWGKHTHGTDNAIVIRDFEQGVDHIRLAVNTQYYQSYTKGSVFTKIDNNGETFNQLYQKALAAHPAYGSMTIAYFNYNDNTYVVESSSLYGSSPEFAFRLTGVYDLTLSDFVIDMYNQVR